MSEIEEKVARLPAWAREHIRHLETCAKPLREEAARCRHARQIAEERLKRCSDRCQAMVELLSFAAKGGHPDAAEYVRYIFAEFGPELVESEHKEAQS